MTKKYTAILFVFITLLALLSSASAECMRNPSSNAIMTINNSVSVPPLILYDSNFGWGDACNTMPTHNTILQLLLLMLSMTWMLHRWCDGTASIFCYTKN